MKRVAGIGGIFFKAKTLPPYRLGMSGTWASTSTAGAQRPSPGPMPNASRSKARQRGPFPRAMAICSCRARPRSWSIVASKTSATWSEVLKRDGCNVLEKIDEVEYGKFAWVIDLEGNKIEPWQPPRG
jgi:hypothetical protein